MIPRVAHLFHEIFLVHAIHGESLPRSRLNCWKKKNSQDEESNGHLLSLSLSFTNSFFLERFPSRSSSFFPPPGSLLLLVFPGHHPSTFLLLVPLIVPLFFARDVPRSLSLSWFHSHLLTSPRGESFSLHVQSLTFRRAVDRQP